jgi:hypothetical protein
MAQPSEMRAGNTQYGSVLRAPDVPKDSIRGDIDFNLDTGVAEDLWPYIKHLSLVVRATSYWPEVGMPAEVVKEMLS